MAEALGLTEEKAHEIAQNASRRHGMSRKYSIWKYGTMRANYRFAVTNGIQDEADLPEDSVRVWSYQAGIPQSETPMFVQEK